MVLINFNNFRVSQILTRIFLVMQTAGRGSCGVSQWFAARETARIANKLDEEGLEMVVCRHGVLLKALNMFRGEIFAYPLSYRRSFRQPQVGSSIAQIFPARTGPTLRGWQYPCRN